MDPVACIRRHAESLGFLLTGIAPAGPVDGWETYRRAIDSGYAGEMGYLADRMNERRDVREVWPDARSVICLAVPYGGDTPDAGPNHGIIARYARGVDYHDWCRDRLDELLGLIRQDIPGVNGCGFVDSAPEAQGTAGCAPTGEIVGGRAFVDSAPLMETNLAVMAGIGWKGRNTLLIHPDHGSFFFLCELVVDVDLPVSGERMPDRCGTCTRCIEACPTGAFVKPGVLDARRCISYLTIELRTSIPRELRSLIGGHVFGCDVCQDVCPWNRRVTDADDRFGTLASPICCCSNVVVRTDFGEDAEIDLIELVGITTAQFKKRFAGTPVLRANRRGLVRNACVALGNVGDERAIPALESALCDASPLVREHAGWALMRIAGVNARDVLTRAISLETEQRVKEGLVLSLRECG